MSDYAELRRRATTAGVFLDLKVPLGRRSVRLNRPVAGEMVTAGDVEEWGAVVTASETEQLLAWLARWTDARRQWRAERAENLAVASDAWQEEWNWNVPQLAIADPPAGFELTRHSWCPRCNRDGDPLGSSRNRCSPDGRPWVRPAPPAPPELEIGPGCHAPIPHYSELFPGKRWFACRDAGRFRSWKIPGGKSWVVPCNARRLFRWGLRRATPVLRFNDSIHSWSAHHELVNWHEQEMSRIILGQSLTTGKQ
jgi:hypothetical protein